MKERIKYITEKNMIEKKWKVKSKGEKDVKTRRI